MAKERIDENYGSRIAYYLPNASITDSPEKLTQIQDWAIATPPKFYAALAQKLSATRRQLLADEPAQSALGAGVGGRSGV